MNPFPGMNPYLERGEWWREIHGAMITFMQLALNRALPMGYFAAAEARVYLEDEEVSRFVPDVFVTERATPSRFASQTTALADAAVEIENEEIEELFLEIRTVGDERVVAVIEVLSPFNKASGRGRDEYKAKQRELLRADVHLLEVDLLRAGTHTVAASASRVPTPHDFLICLHRGSAGGRFTVWHGTVREHLPRVLVPLRAPDADVVLDVGAALNSVYDAGAFSRRINYNLEPDPPLSPDVAAWSDTLLREKGLRS